jgi:hypothetical protein
LKFDGVHLVAEVGGKIRESWVAVVVAAAPYLVANDEDVFDQGVKRQFLVSFHAKQYITSLFRRFWEKLLLTSSAGDVLLRFSRCDGGLPCGLPWFC